MTYINNYQTELSPRAHAYVAIKEAKIQGIDTRFFKSPEALAASVKVDKECVWSVSHEIGFLMLCADVTSKMWFKGFDHLRRTNPKAFYKLYEEAYENLSIKNYPIELQLFFMKEGLR